MVPTDDENLEILDRSFDVFAEFATKIRYVNFALTTRQQLTTVQLAQSDLTCLSLAANCVDEQLSGSLKYLSHRIML